MNTKYAFALALKKVRKAKKLTQEDFSDISSRTYLSTLERGLKSPTLDKLDALAGAMKIHPVTLILLTYLELEEHLNKIELIELVKNQLSEFDLN